MNKYNSKAAVFTEIMLAVFRVNGRLLEKGDQLVLPLSLTSARWQVLGAVALAGDPVFQFGAHSWQTGIERAVYLGWDNPQGLPIRV